MIDVKILPELKRLIPPLTPKEYSQLEANCIQDGIRDPIVLWKRLIDKEHPDFSFKCYGYKEDEDVCLENISIADGCFECGKCNAGVAGWEYEYILVDGHNRFEISEKHGLKYNVSYLDLYDIDDVKDWMNKNQLGRRNIHPKHFKILLGRIYNRTKKAASGRNDRNFGVTKKVTPKTHQQIADAFGIGEQTVVRAGKQQNIIQQLAEEEGKSEFEVIDELGKDKNINAIAAKLKTNPDKPISDIKNEVLKKESQRKKAKTNKRKEIKETLEKLSLLDIVGNKKFRIIYADPPWQYSDGLNIDGYGIGTGDHYVTMPLDAICQMPVKQIAEKNAILFIWVTSPFLESVFKVINAWGFKYKSSFVWDKVGHVMGHYNSVRHEFLLIATKGSCTPDLKKLFDSVQQIKKTPTHSEKPEEFRQIIDTLYTWGNKIELFGRKNIEDWDIFGNQNL